MKDLIDRQEAIDALHMHLMYRMGTDSNKKRLDEWINGVPSVQPEPRWIPCSERLPEEYGNYLITTYDGNVDIGTIDPNGKSVWSACDADGFYWMRNVIAWMPLPEPYRAKRRTDE